MEDNSIKHIFLTQIRQGTISCRLEKNLRNINKEETNFTQPEDIKLLIA